MMNSKEIEQEEKYYKKFQQEGARPQNQEETRAFHLYARMHHQFHNTKIPIYDKNSIVSQMVMKMEEQTGRGWFVCDGSRIARYAGITIYIGVFVILFVVCSNIFLSIDWNLTQSIQFISTANQELRVPAFWKYRLWCGKKVSVPPGIRATMTLSDGSELDCPSGTQIAIQFGQNRQIDLTSGGITIHASPNKENPMIVTTPVGDVQVIGTIFLVELTR